MANTRRSVPIIGGFYAPTDHGIYMEQRLRDTSIANNLIVNAEHWIGARRDSDVVIDRLLAFRSELGNMGLERRVFGAAKRLSEDIGDYGRATQASRLLEERRWRAVALRAAAKAVRR